MTYVLPKTIADYLTADAAVDAEASGQCFTEDALVHDEGRDIRGRDAIVQWKAAGHAKYQYTAELLGFREDDETVVVHAGLTGNFPGSPVEIDYRFILRDGLIAELSID